jgi:hypothetical protein
MRIPALIRQIPDGGFRASTFDVSADASTPEGAVEALKARLRPLLDSAPQIVDFEMTVPGEEHPLTPFFGMLRDDPLFEEWQQAIEDYRRQIDEDPSIR